METNDAVSTIVTATRVFLGTCVSMIARLAIRKTCSRAFDCNGTFAFNNDYVVSDSHVNRYLNSTLSFHNSAKVRLNKISESVGKEF